VLNEASVSLWPVESKLGKLMTELYWLRDAASLGWVTKLLILGRYDDAVRPSVSAVWGGTPGT